MDATTAAEVLADVLDASAHLGVREALVVESLAYSVLLGGPEFDRWLRDRGSRPVPPCADPVLVERDGGTLHVTLNRPERRNAFGAAVRDGLLDALAVAEADPEITEVALTGAGPSFCSGGDLDEFGTASDPATAHVVRMRHSAGLAVHRLRDRVRPLLHGACVGAGIEVPAFAAHVAARPDATFRLPELSMGLIPGAGGTVGIVRRLGRDRFEAWLHAGTAIDADTALAWGLVDEVVA